MHLGYQAFLFDLGYTLITTDRELTLQKQLRHMGIDVSIGEIDRAYHFVDKYFMREFPGKLGKDPRDFMEEYLCTLLDHMGLPIGVEQFGVPSSEQVSRGVWSLIPGTDWALKSLREQGVKTGLVSNWDLSARAVLRQTGLEQLFDVVVISAEVGVEKPDPTIFELALSVLDVSAGDALYIGDNYYDDIVGARRLGMEGVLINRFDRFGIEEIVDDCEVFASVPDLVRFLQQGVLRS